MKFDAARFVVMFEAIADRLEKEKGHLCELDGHIGDADHGIAMAQGFNAVRKAVSELDADASASDVFNAAAKSFLNAVGASSGPLYATAFMRAGAALKGVDAPREADVAAAFAAMAKGIQDRGKAEIGEKTMVDAWAPAAKALTDAREKGDGLARSMAAALQAAAEGAESTRNMVAAKGRASRLGERAIGHVDPGAASAAMIVEEIARSLGGEAPATGS